MTRCAVGCEWRRSEGNAGARAGLSGPSLFERWEGSWSHSALPASQRGYQVSPRHGDPSSVDTSPCTDASFLLNTVPDSWVKSKQDLECFLDDDAD